MLKNFINNLPDDKLKHIVVGVVYSMLIPFLAFIFGDAGAMVGFGVGTFLNAWKELYNDFYKKNGNPEVLDFVYNEIPILVVYATYLI